MICLAHNLYFIHGEIIWDISQFRGIQGLLIHLLMCLSFILSLLHLKICFNTYYVLDTVLGNM